MPYPDAVNLPFNATVVAHGFAPAPHGVPDNGSPGVWAVLRGNSLVVQERGGALLLPEGEWPPWLPADREPLVAGLWHGRPLRAARIATRDPLPPSFVAEPFNAAGEHLDDVTLTLGGIAQQVLHWESGSRFCARCGGVTERLPTSWGKRCTGCGADHFPHIHPCAIVLVKRGDEFLLARKPEWAPGRYGLAAGTLLPGFAEVQEPRH
ncbi:NAD(+) diphosphatase, partial [bacterium]|nr:NAD(+) diphosphatase [bacterium]